MQKKYLIGIDLGTSSTKAALYQIDGALVSEASAEVPLFYPKPGVVEQENEDFYTTAAKTVRKCIESSGVKPEGIAAIAFDSQMAGVGSIDENYQSCRPLVEKYIRLEESLHQFYKSRVEDKSKIPMRNY